MGKRKTLLTHGRSRSLSDPLTAALMPPPNETPEERELREAEESRARMRSEELDEIIRKDGIERKKSKAEVNVLLLGQSESGKSTTLKQFQLLHSPQAFHRERLAWRAVIYLNLVRSVRRILDALTPEADTIAEDDTESLAESLSTAEHPPLIISSSGRPPSAISGTKVPNYESYRRRLEPLIDLEEKLIKLLSSPDEEQQDGEATRLPVPGSPSNRHMGMHMGMNMMPLTPNRPPQAYNMPYKDYPSPRNGRPHLSTIEIPSTSYSTPVSPSSGGRTHSTSPGGSTSTGSSRSTSTTSTSTAKSEVSVHANKNWRKAFSLGSISGRSKSPKSPNSNEIQGWWEEPDDPVHPLNRAAPAMMELWRDGNVRRRLGEKRLRLEESAGFYLDEIPRITALKYIPTDADILKARLKTMGVLEHTFQIANGSNKGVTWKIYDVGGARNQRHAWAPYFEDVNAIIFLAPISAFDQVLAEDPTTNRLEDSIILWKTVVQNKLLVRVNMVLFLNKCDLLQAKLEAGVRLNHHMVSYNDRPNDYETVSKYFYNKFGAIHHQYSPNKERELYIHFTTVTDTRQTATIIQTVRDIIIKANLRSLKLV